MKILAVDVFGYELRYRHGSYVMSGGRSIDALASTVAAGLATVGAYALVLAALERASAASVAAVRETSVVIAALLAGKVLSERVGPVRLAGAVLVAAGVALVSLA